MVRVINVSYKISKSNFIWRKKVEENQKNIGRQLNGVSKAIQSMAKDLEKDLEVEEKYENQKTEIIELLRQKEIEVQDLVIKKDNRFLIEIYLDEILETAKIEIIEDILTKVLKEKIVLNDEASVGKRLNFLSEDKYIMANSKAYDDADVAANEMIMAMKATAETAQPMPNIPQMSVMWGPTEEFLAAVNKSGEDIDTAAETYQQEALDAIADMQ